MEKKKSDIFAGKVSKKAGNNKYVSYSNKEEPKSAKNINQKINEIFNSTDYVYKADVNIKLKDKTITKRIIGKNQNYLITIENELIPIADIIDINKK